MKRSKPPARLPSSDSEWLACIREAQETRADLEVSIAIDGVSLISSRSVDDADHCVTVIDGRAARCSCPKFRFHKRPCRCRAFVAIKLWELEMGADLSEVGAIALRDTLINAYLDAPRKPFVKYWIQNTEQPEITFDAAMAELRLDRKTA